MNIKINPADPEDISFQLHRAVGCGLLRLPNDVQKKYTNKYTIIANASISVDI